MGALTGDWLTISEEAGTGDAQLSATVTKVNKGRNSRQVVVVGETAHGATATATVTQSGASEYVSFDSASYNMANTDNDVTITGKSNSKKLTFQLDGQDRFLQIPASFTATKGALSQSVALSPSVAELSPDYGATGEYSFSITLPKTSSASSPRTCQLIVTAFGGASATTTVNQAGVASTILLNGETDLQVSGDRSFYLNIGVTPSGEGWELAFDS